MIIFDNAIYIHNPKCAGTSFEDMCWDRHGIGVTGKQHDTARDIPKEMRDRWVFGFMRDPLRAEYSNYRYHRFSWGGNDRFTFEEWCRWRYEEERDYGKRFDITQRQLEYGHIFNIRPAAGYFCDESGKCIAQAIFRFEELQDGIQTASDKVGLNLNLEGTTGMTYSWSRGNEIYDINITETAKTILRKAKGIDFMLHSWRGKVPTNYICPTVPDYAYSR